MFSPKDVYRLDPPHNLRASDWVIDLPCPEPRLEGSLGSTRQQHRSVRIQQLVEYVDNRFYKGRFFYKFLTENRGKDPSSGQHVVTGIFAYHEIEHWPGAYSHLQWTKFLMENIEYDALAEARGSEEGLILPTLPTEALPILTAVKRIEGKKLATMSARTGKSTKELTAYEFERDRLETQRLDVIADPRIAGLFQHTAGVLDQTGEPPIIPEICNPVHQFNTHVSKESTNYELRIPQSGSEISPLQSNPRPQLLEPFNARLEYRIIHEASQNHELFVTVCEEHAGWARRQVKNQHRLMLRIIFGSPESESQSWDYCYNIARQMIHNFADHAFHTWRLHNPDVPFDENRQFPNWLRKQYEYLFATIQSRDPLPTNRPVEFIRAMCRQQVLLSMLRQRDVLLNWTAEMKARACERRESRYRYRFEPTAVLDVWTGDIHTVEEFAAKARKEKVLGNRHPDIAQRAAVSAMAGKTVHTAIGKCW